MPDSYLHLRLGTAQRDARGLIDGLRGHTVPAWEADGVRCWGIWQGLLGLASNEVLMMAAVQGEGGVPATCRDHLPPDAGVVDELALRSTVRPENTEPLHGEGLYVFRYFDVALADCDEIVALSAEAWRTFETTDRYASRPRGLFRPADDGRDRGRMLLVTWYDGFASWETSRAPAPEARENFRRRHELTAGTVAFATRLVT